MPVAKRYLLGEPWATPKAAHVDTARPTAARSRRRPVRWPRRPSRLMSLPSVAASRRLHIAFASSRVVAATGAPRRLRHLRARRSLGDIRWADECFAVR